MIETRHLAKSEEGELMKTLMILVAVLLICGGVAFYRSGGTQEQVQERVVGVDVMQTGGLVDTTNSKPGDLIKPGTIDLTGASIMEMQCVVEARTRSRFCFDVDLQRKLIQRNVRLSELANRGSIRLRFTSKLSESISVLPGGQNRTTYQVLEVLE